MNKFIKLHVIDNDTIVIDYVNINQILKVYMDNNNVHVKLVNGEVLKLKDENLDVFMDRFYFTK
tara:strand:+ start:1129 stop:1320 length:192 start_codon:yes stop_codon:yes gene_type:complete